MKTAFIVAAAYGLGYAYAKNPKKTAETLFVLTQALAAMQKNVRQT